MKTYYRWKDVEELAIYESEWSKWYLLKSDLDEDTIQLRIDKGQAYQICTKKDDKIIKIWGYEI